MILRDKRATRVDPRRFLVGPIFDPVGTTYSESMSFESDAMTRLPLPPVHQSPAPHVGRFFPGVAGGAVQHSTADR